MIGEAIVLLLQALNDLANLLGISNILAQYFVGQKTPSWASLQLSEQSQTLDYLSSPTYGLQALAALIAAFKTDVDTQLAALSTQVGTPQQAGSDVTLPSAFPGTWDVGVFDAVWDSSIDGVNTTGIAVSRAGAFIDKLSVLGIQYQQFFAPLMVAGMDWGATGAGTNPTPYNGPTLNPSTIQAGDATAYAWVTRAYPSPNWFQDSIGRPFYGNQTNSLSWVVDLDQAGFELLKATTLSLPPFATSNQPAPVWPGLANVALGTSVALAQGVTITEAMDGVLIDITSAPAFKGKFTFDTAISYRNIGGLAFVSDDGQEEYPQLLGFQKAVYCPKSMLQASGVVIRTVAGVVGTVTPWLAVT